MSPVSSKNITTDIKYRKIIMS